ncbi:hypothetical protein PSTT_13120 [Puccinia striiformis]|uniref:2-(3-amino-3-carboxypropyl)histidine synthase subunit 1 n=1 Tax=Puccinia striiformis TaxID=27350 RepID=A0A2S4UTC2_9BASI|nr:hypothetical protein PSTT_13120 [Puccinia striiformis]
MTETNNTKIKKKFIGKTGGAAKTTNNNKNPRRTNEIPQEITENKQLNETIRACLPPTYNFELHKTIHQLTTNGIQTLGLQMPEGLLQFSLIISDIIRKFVPTCQNVIVLGDVTYGACCVDDFTAKALGCQMLIHYGHSCLIPVDQTSIKTLYVFVEIGIDRKHLTETIRANFPTCLKQPSHKQHISIQAEDSQEQVHLAVVGTVQFVSAVQAIKQDLEQPQDNDHNIKLITDQEEESNSVAHSSSNSQCQFKVTIPQIKPLSPGEILGCTAPKLSSTEIDAILYLGDGRFHLESIMITNPNIPAFRYDPYEKKITREGYDHVRMRETRASAISLASSTLFSTDQDRAWAVVLGTLGRQANMNAYIVNNHWINTQNPQKTLIPILISELSAIKLGLISKSIDVCIQTSCPRLSIDWGHDFLVDRSSSSSTSNKESEKESERDRVIPLLNPYEVKVALGQVKSFQIHTSIDDNPNDDLLETYPMDFYADQSLGDWTPRHGRNIRPKRS